MGKGGKERGGGKGKKGKEGEKRGEFGGKAGWEENYRIVGKRGEKEKEGLSRQKGILMGKGTSGGFMGCGQRGLGGWDWESCPAGFGEVPVCRHSQA